jgi:small-conductance mechanosensitive channel
MNTVKRIPGFAFPVFALLVALATPAVASAAAGAAAAGAPPPAAQSKAPAGGDQQAQVPQVPTAIRVPEIVRRAEEVAKLLRELEALAEPQPAIDAIQARLPEVNARLAPEFESTLEILKSEPPLPIVERKALSWQASRLELAVWDEVLTRRATRLESALDRLAGLRATWTQTRAEVRASRAPAAVVRRVDAVLADIEAMRGRIQAQRADTLVLQDRVGREVARCQDALDRIAQYRQGGLRRMVFRSTRPIWSSEVRGHELQKLPARAPEAVVASLAVLRQFADAHAGRFLFQGLLFIGLVLVVRAARGRSRARVAAGEGTLPAAPVFDRPYSSAAVVALASTSWLYPDRPQTVVDVVAILLLLPMLRIVRPHVRPALVPALYGFAALFFVDRVRAELAVVPLAEQILLLFVTLAAMAGLAWLLGSGRLRRAPAGEPIAPLELPGGRATATLALAIYAASFAAGAYGVMRLGRMLAAGVFVGLFLALVAYAAVQVMDALATFALREWPLRRLGMVERHRDLLERRLHLVICWSAAFVWATGNLRFHGLLQPALALSRAALAAEVRQGTIGISLGDVLAFVLTVWVAFLLSAGIRFVLEEDVYPRLHLARGLPYVISSLLNYAILFLGFLLAMGALRVDLNKVTLLAGAFGVGLGFGLQGVVNNFVSGLIVLFERPVRLGDAIQMADLAGEVRRIGIRSSTVRTWEGAEVIVPNASLVSEKVTNWTHSDRLRRMDVPVGVAYGTAPGKVLELLTGVAGAHPDVLTEPAPQALFLGFGDSALNFELRAWTNRFDRWVVIRSELGVAVYAALRAAAIEIPFPQREVRVREGR